MADRITVTTGTVAGLQSPAGPRAARFIITGQTQFGPTDAPRVVRNLRDYLNTYGARSGGASMYDAAETFFACGGGELVVQRAFGPSAVNATIGLDSSKIVVTSRWPGAYYNAWTAAYTSATVTLTIVKGSRTVTYSAGAGGTAAQLQAAASVDPDVTVTVSSLPASNVAATNLASGADDFANVNWTTVLARSPRRPAPVRSPPRCERCRVGARRPRRRQPPPGAAVAEPDRRIRDGHHRAGQHHRRVQAVRHLRLPWVTVPDGTGGRKTIDGVSAAAGQRAVAQRVYGIGDSPLRRSVHQLTAAADVRPLTEVDDTTHTSLLAAGVATIRSLPTAVGLDVWATAEGVGANAKLAEAIYRDMTNAIADDAARVLDQFVGRPATAAVLADATSAIKGVVETGYVDYLVGGDGVGYKVAVSNGTDPADNRISAVVSLKFAEEIGFVDLTINAASADQTI